MPVPGRKPQGTAITGVPGITPAPPGDWAPVGLFWFRSLKGIRNLAARLTAVAGSAIVLRTCHLVTGRRGRRGHR
jgi:hypothetical protein